MTTKFEEALAVDVKPFTERKQNYDYLTWSVAWRKFKEVYPDATYEIKKGADGFPLFNRGELNIVFTEVTADGLTYEMWLPVMNYRNDPIVNPNSNDVNKSIMRCFVKNLAMFGLGLSVYAGEDLPEEPKDSTSSLNNTHTMTEEEAKTWVDKALKELDEGDDYESTKKNLRASNEAKYINTYYKPQMARLKSFIDLRDEELSLALNEGYKYGV